MKKNYILISVYALTILSTHIAFGYESSTHGRISNDALATLKNCNIEIHQLRRVENIAQGSIEEDTTDTALRLSNWHFYNTYGNLKQGPLIYESLDNIFKYRNEKLIENIQFQRADSITNSLGRVLHYIQDMFVPAHVVPVFHGKPFDRTDAFDNYQLDESERASLISSVDCNSLKSNAEDKFTTYKNNQNIFLINQQILNRSAHSTLKQLSSKIEDQSVLWNYFWREPISKVMDFWDTSSTLVGMGVQSKRSGQ